MHPITDPSMHGMGNSPSFLVEGGWVVGFFRDAETLQQPIIMGSLLREFLANLLNSEMVSMIQDMD